MGFLHCLIIYMLMFLEYLIIFFSSISPYAFIYFSKMLVRHLKKKKTLKKMSSTVKSIQKLLYNTSVLCSYFDYSDSHKSY